MKQLIYKGQVVPDYYVHPETGDIYSTKYSIYGTKMKPTLDTSKGYMCITIRHNKKSIKVEVHRVVAETLVTFSRPKNITPEDWRVTPQSVKDELKSQYRVNHIDHDRSNYHPSNLEWVTAQGNALAYQKFRVGLQ